MVEESPEMIKAQMAQTRQDLTQKIETLEQTVVQTVHEATSAVSSTVDAVKGVVDDTASAVSSTVDTVKSAVGDTVDSVKDTLNLSNQIERHPLLMLGGAVLTGFVVGKMLPTSSSSHSQSGTQSWPQSWTGAGAASGTSGASATSGSNGSSDRKSEQNADSWLPSGLMNFLQKPMDLAQGVAVGSLFTLVRDVLKQSLPAESWSKEILGVVEDLNRQLGGQPFQSSKDTGTSRDQQQNGDTNNAERDISKMAGSVGATDRQSQEPVGSSHRR